LQQLGVAVGRCLDLELLAQAAGVGGGIGHRNKERGV